MMARLGDFAAQVADDLVNILAPLQDALHYLTDGGAQDVRRRVVILFSLAEPEERSVKHLAAELDVSESDIKKLAFRGLVKYAGGQASLTPAGESLVALLFMMSKDLDGGTSEGILDLVQAAQAGDYETDFIVSLVLGSGKRLAQRLEATTKTEELDHIEERRSDRKTAWKRVDKVLEILHSDVDPQTAIDLRSVSSRLVNVGSKQQEVLTRIKAEDFRLPDGSHYSDLVRLMSKQPDDALAAILAKSPIVRRRPYRALDQIRFNEAVKHQFAAPVEAEAVVEVAMPVQGDIWHDQALLQFEAAISNVPDGTLWHEVEQSPRSYLRGVWYALQQRLPKRIREAGIQLELTGDRLAEAPNLDVPIIRVRRTHE